MTSGSAINEGIINTLAARSASAFVSGSPTGNIGMRDLGILDTVQGGSAWFLYPPAVHNEPTSFGNPPEEGKTYTTHGVLYVKDNGSVTWVFERIYQGEIDLRQGLLGDADIGGSVHFFHLRDWGGWDGQTFVETNGGAACIPVDFYIETFQQEVN